METIGNYLKRQREIRKIPLQDISTATKINLRFLKALEEDALGTLPGPAFAKGFVKSYAKSIGLDPEEVTLQMEEHLKVTLDSHAKARFKWLPHPKWQTKPWMYFSLFLLIVVIAAYVSSR